MTRRKVEREREEQKGLKVVKVGYRHRWLFGEVPEEHFGAGDLEQ